MQLQTPWMWGGGFFVCSLGAHSRRREESSRLQQSVWQAKRAELASLDFREKNGLQGIARSDHLQWPGSIFPGASRTSWLLHKQMGWGMCKMLVGTWALIFREVRSQYHYRRPWSSVGSQKLLWLLGLCLWIFMVLGTEPRALCMQGKHYHWAVALSSQSPALPHPSQNKPLSDHYFTWPRTHLSV